MSLLYLQKNMVHEMVLLRAVKHESFLQDDTVILGLSNQSCPNHHLQQACKLAISLQNLKENRKNEVHFLLPDKHQRFLQIETINLDVCVARHAQVTQWSKFAVSLQYLNKEMSHKVDLLHADKHESFLQIDAMIFDGGWSSIPKVPKITSLQYLCNISNKTGRMKLVFIQQTKMKDFFKFILSFQVCLDRHAENI